MDSSSGSNTTRNTLAVFQRFIKRGEGEGEGGGNGNDVKAVDVSGVASRECYSAWAQQQQQLDQPHDEHAFRADLLLHVTGNNRAPFEPAEEAAILYQLRHNAANFLPVAATVAAPVGHHEQILLLHGASTQNQLAQLQHEDAAYLSMLASQISSNYASGGAEDWAAVKQILRLMILGRTTRCCKSPLVSTAEVLCQQHVLRHHHHQPSSKVFVMDLAAALPEHCLMAHHNVGGGGEESMDHVLRRGSLFATVITIGAAYHRPGTLFTLPHSTTNDSSSSTNSEQKQQDTESRLDDDAAAVHYYVDPGSFFLVMFT